MYLILPVPDTYVALNSCSDLTATQYYSYVGNVNHSKEKTEKLRDTVFFKDNIKSKGRTLFQSVVNSGMGNPLRFGDITWKGQALGTPAGYKAIKSLSRPGECLDPIQAGFMNGYDIERGFITLVDELPWEMNRVYSLLIFLENKSGLVLGGTVLQWFESYLNGSWCFGT